MFRISKIIEIGSLVTILFFTFSLFISLYNLWKDLSEIENTSIIHQSSDKAYIPFENDETAQKGKISNFDKNRIKK